MRLRAYAVGNRCSIEEETLNLLHIELEKPLLRPQSKQLDAAINELFKDLGFGIEVQPRDENPDPAVRYNWLDEGDDDNR